MAQNATDCAQVPGDPPPMQQDLSCSFIGARIQSFFTTAPGWISLIGTVLIGITLGVPGGLLLGSLEGVTLNCLEELTNMGKLSKTLEYYGIQYSLGAFSGEIGNFTAILSSAVGLILGVVSYSWVMKLKGEGAAGKALAVAGPVCVMGVSATGAALGSILEKMLPISESATFVDVVLRYPPAVLTLVGLLLIVLAILCIAYFVPSDDSSLSRLWGFKCFKFTLILAGTGNILLLVFSVAVLIDFLLNSHAMALLVLIYTAFKVMKFDIVHSSQGNMCLNLECVSVSIMVFTIEIFATCVKPVTAASAEAEVLFNGILFSQLLMAGIGMSAFVSWQKGGAGKTCVVAAGLGTTILGSVKMVGPGLCIGALMGVAGAVGVYFSAAGTKANSFGQVGRLGVTMGAALGAFLASTVNSGLSGIFMGLCAAMLPFAHYCEILFIFLAEFLFNRERNHFHHCIGFCIMIVLFVLWLNYTYRPIFSYPT